ncbi:hypothetical protein FSW04_01480 [Baekduia soli]|uniref:Glycosyltransferase RgtA/B/C/D-like domain-containing protein n=1 Tax=Baekduia soli TaxID=496014 RepID=A0A5B8U061_9ACTN|nr:hypothetical protein [Baekduia soli]QEC46379.1 hypothetical protein FSW04_01480 [Baekduia soli]
MGRLARRVSRRPALTIALAIAVLMSASAALELRWAPPAHGRLSADERAYLRLARDVVERGHWGDLGLKQPFRWAPGTPLLFAAAAELTGQPVDRQTAVGAQVAVGTLLIPATFLLAAALAGPLAGLGASVVVTVYQPLSRASGTTGTETLGALMIVLALLMLAWSMRDQGRRPTRFLAAGGTLGLAALVRGDLVPVAVLLPFVVTMAASRISGMRRGLMSGAVMLSGAVAVMAPWSVFASSHAHHVVPVTDGGAANLFVGTDLPANGTIFGVKRQFAAQTRRVHPATRHVRTFALPEELVLDAVAAQYPGRTRDAALRAAARENLRRYALGRPVAFAGMEVRKLWRMWGGAYAGTRHRAGPGATWEHRLLAGVALLGLLGAIGVVRDMRLVVLLAFIVLTTVVDVVFVSEARHNVRLMPALLAGGSAGWSMIIRRVHGRRGTWPCLVRGR